MSSVKHRKENDCLNCGHIVEESFCPHCGQENIVVKEDALHMVYHAIADYFHFEHKFFGTLKPLLLKPGQLTKEYVAGKRVAFIHPIRLYIFISIVFFLIVLSGNNNRIILKDKDTKTTQIAKTQKDSLQDEKVTNAKQYLKYIPNSNGMRDSILEQAREEIKKDTVLGVTYLNKSKINKINKVKLGGGNWVTLDSTITDYEKNQVALSKDKRDGFIKHYFIKKSIEFNDQENPQEKFIEDLLHNIPKMMFLLLPLFALFLKLVYITKNKYYYEHLIYSFHVHSAIFLSIIFTITLQRFFALFYNIDYILSFICMIYVLWYIYRSLRTFYDSKRWVTVLKIIFLNFCYSMALTLCFLLIMAISFISV